MRVATFSLCQHSVHPMRAICGEEILIKIFFVFEKVRILPFFSPYMSQGSTTESHPFADFLPYLLSSQGLNNNKHKVLRSLGFVCPLLGGEV